MKNKKFKYIYYFFYFQYLNNSSDELQFILNKNYNSCDQNNYS